MGQQVREALAGLSPVEREAVVLADWGGYSRREIAELTGAPLGTVKSGMHFALKDLLGHVRVDGEQPTSSMSPSRKPSLRKRG